MIEEKDVYWRKRLKTNSTETNPSAIEFYNNIKDKDNASLLELGCGNGADSLFFASKGLNVTAVDVSSETLNNIKEENSLITCIHKDIKDISFPPASFDAIYARLSLHYFSDADTQIILKKIYDLLKPNGMIYMKCKSTDDSSFGKGEKVGDNIYNLGHLRHFFDLGYTKDTFKKAGLVIKNIEETSKVFDEKKSAFIEALACREN